MTEGNKPVVPGPTERNAWRMSEVQADLVGAPKPARAAACGVSRATDAAQPQRAGYDAVTAQTLWALWKRLTGVSHG